MMRCYTPGSRQNLRQYTAAARHVQDDQHGGAQIARQWRDKNAQRFNAPR
jgi:hypothetical protein